MKEIEIINAFGTTNTCRTLDEKISALEQEKIQKREQKERKHNRIDVGWDR